MLDFILYILKVDCDETNNQCVQVCGVVPTVVTI